MVVPTQPEDTRKARIAVLNEELESIHYANTVYWRLGKDHSREAGVEYQRRQDRLEEIRNELVALRE
jgi:hypothetical protein